MDDAVLAAFADAVVDRAVRLAPGMVLRPGTAAANSLRGQDGDPRDRLYVVVDGDDQATPCTSLIGPVAADDRVMVMFAPPQGMLVFAWATVPARFRVATTTALATTWTGAGSPTCDYSVDLAGWVSCEYAWTLTGNPAGGNLVVDLPYQAAKGNCIIGIVRLGGMAFGATPEINCIARTGGAQVSWFVEDHVGNLLSSAHASSGDTLTAAIRYLRG